MKITTTLIFLLLTTLFLKSSAQRNIDTTLEILKRVNYASYVGKPVDSLLHNIPNNYDSLDIVSHHIPFYASELFVMYPNDVVLVIRVDKFRFMNPYWDIETQSQPNWDISLFKKENIQFSALAKGPVCYVGCDQFYSH